MPSRISRTRKDKIRKHEILRDHFEDQYRKTRNYDLAHIANYHGNKAITYRLGLVDDVNDARRRGTYGTTSARTVTAPGTLYPKVRR